MEIDDPATLNTMSTHGITQKVLSSDLLLLEKHGRSRVWTIFAAIMTRNGVELEFVYCKICLKAFKHSNAQTSNLIRHSCYIKKFINAESDITMTNIEIPPADGNNSLNNLSKLFSKWIIKACVSCELIKSDDLMAIFHEIIRLGSTFGDDLDIEKLLPTVPMIAKNVSAVYVRCFHKVKAEIAAIKENGFGLTTDIWTDGFRKRSYMLLTIHYLKSGLLTFRVVGLKALQGEITTYSPRWHRRKTMEVDDPATLNIMTTYEIAQKVVSGDLLLLEKHGRSRVWTIFSAVITRDGVELEFVYCKVCLKAFKRSNAQTSNLIRHGCYIKKFINAESDITMTNIETPPADGNNSLNNLSKLFSKWIMKGCVPCELIKSDDLMAIFNEMKRLGSTFGGDLDIEKLLPTVPVIAKNVSAVYVQWFHKVKAEIAAIKENGFGLTTDIWTDGFRKRSYMLLTIHYLKSSVLTFRVMGLKALQGEITNQNIVAKVEQILEDFECNLSNKSIIVTHEDVPVPNVENLPCISQLLNSALLKSIEEVPEVAQIVNSCSKLVKFLKREGSNTNLRQLLITSQPNSWITVYKMLNSVEKNWSEIENSLGTSAGETTVDIQRLKAVINVFQPFEDAIETLEDDSHATLHLIIVLLHELKKKTCPQVTSDLKDFQFIENLKKTIRLYLEKMENENIKTLHKLALFLYPPTNKLLRFNEAERKLVDDECIRVMKCFRNESEPPVKSEVDPLATPACNQLDLFSDFLESETNYNSDELIKAEIQCYKNTRVVNSPDFNVFNWWEQQKFNFPLLFKLSCTVLATPATIAKSKQFLSPASSLLCEKYKQELTEGDIEKIIFLKSNLQSHELNSHFSAQK